MDAIACINSRRSIPQLDFPPPDKETLEKFQQLIFDGESKFKNIGYKILAFFLGVTGIYSFLFATGNWIYGETLLALVLSLTTLVSIAILRMIWKRIS